MYKKILIATDGSELSQKAVDSGIALALLSGAEIVALQVVQRYPVVTLKVAPASRMRR